MKKLIAACLLLYIRIFARIALLLHPVTVIGITGSAGKTSARDVLFAIMKEHFKTHVIVKGNSETGIPLGILGLKIKSLGFSSLHKSVKDWLHLIVLSPLRIHFLKDYEYVIIEMGVDDPYPPKNMTYLLSIVKPDIALVLNVSETHGEQFEKVVSPPVTSEKILSAIAHEKCKIATHNPRCRYVVYNNDSPPLRAMLEPLDIEKGTFGHGRPNVILYDKYTVTFESTTFGFILPGDNKLSIKIKGYALPQVYQETLAAALVIALHLGIRPTDIKSALEKNFALEPGRCSILSGIADSVIIDSSYNASPDSMRTLIELAFRLKKQTKRPLMLVLGDMRELGVLAEEKHKELADALLGYADYLYTVGPLMEKHVFDHAQKKHQCKDIQAFMSPHEVGKYLKKHPIQKAIMLFKGSQNTIFLEEAIKYVLADPDDAALLTRQEDYWLRKKQFTLPKNLLLH